MSLAIAAIRGAYITGMALAFRQVISFSTTLYIARLLPPSDFGTFAMVMVVIGFAQVIGDIGISAGLVRSQKNSKSVLDTCFWIGLGIGTALAVLVFLLAPLAASFYGVAAIEPLLRTSALGLIVSFCLPVPLALLQQRLNFREIALAQTSGSFSGAIVAVILASTGHGIWGLVLQPIAGNLVSLTLMAIRTKWYPTNEYDYKAVQDIIHDGFNLLGAGLTQFARNNFDTVVIGKALQSKDLGVYGLAQTILYAPMYLITSVVSRVLFPLLAKIQNDHDKVKEAILTSTSRTALLIFPLYLGIFVVADDFVLLAFGDMWLDLIPLIRIMTIAFLIQSVSGIAAPIMLSLGKSRLLLRINLGGAVFYFAVLMVAIRYSITSVATGYALANSVIGILTIGLALRIADIKLIEYSRAVGRPLILASVMALGVFAASAMFVPGSMLRLSAAILVGALIYCSLIFLFEKSAWQQFYSAARR